MFDDVATMTDTHLEFSFSLMTEPPRRKILQSFYAEAGLSPSKQTLAQLLKGQTQRVQWVCMKQGRDIVGIARLEVAPPEFCYLSDLMIQKRRRGRGVGRQFVRAIETHCARMRISRLLLATTAETKGFYEKLGFVSDSALPGMLRRDINPLARRVFVTP